MKVNIDLHSHSNYSPGVFNISLEKVAYSMGLKGVDVMGTGDYLFPKWRNFLKENLVETAEGIFRLRSITENYYDLDREIAEMARFILQTELIFTFAKEGIKGRKRMDIVLLFPSLAAVDAAIKLLSKWGVKNTTGRPFILCRKPQEVGEKIRELAGLDPWVEIIPAHIMTPEGIFGSRNNIDSLEEVFGDSLPEIHVIETGLSADLEVLSLIPELDTLTLVSSSDAHSAGLNVIGRESTVIDVGSISYIEVVSAIRENKITHTVEFPPSEGKYFLTGHRGDRPGHQGKPCYYSLFLSPSSRLCLICKKKLDLGVLERVFELGKKQRSKRRLGELKSNARPFVLVVSLFDILRTMGQGEKEYVAICRAFRSELGLWKADKEETEKKLSALNLDEGIIESIQQIKQGDFCFNPPGYDGVFGKLKIGEKIDLLRVKEESDFEDQLNLF